jgi:hypothetical protein
VVRRWSRNPCSSQDIRIRLMPTTATRMRGSRAPSRRE